MHRKGHAEDRKEQAKQRKGHVYVEGHKHAGAPFGRSISK